MADPLTATSVGISALSTGMSAAGTLMGGNAQADATGFGRFYELIAAQNRQQELKNAADETRAAGQRQAFEYDRNKDLALSRARAVAAASGGGATDTSVVNTMAGIEAQGEYQKAMEMYGAETRARQLETASQNAMIEAFNNDQATQYQAKALRRKARSDAFGTILSGAGSALDKYTLSKNDKYTLSKKGYYG